MRIDKSLYTLPNASPVCDLDCRNAFNLLSDTEKKYAHFMGKACFDGSLVVFCQTSAESPALFVTLHRLFSSESIELLKSKATSLGWTDEHFTAFLVFAAGFYANSGNYKGFGDTKIVPNVDKGKLFDLLSKSAAAEKYPSFMETYKKIEDRIYSLDDKYLRLGFSDKAVTAYHSKGVTKEDVDFVDRYFKSRKLEQWNTRLIKEVVDGRKVYTIRLASADSEKKELSREEFEGATIVIERCDYGPLMSKTISWLKQSLNYVANENQRKMIECYVKHFESGELNDHKDGSRFWIKDVGPNVESYIGFIENYRDPAGTRSEFEGFVAVVNKETTKKFSELVKRAEEFLTRLPWEKEYEKDKFLKPDFTALEVIGFGGSGIPSGINIPNYDEVRQNEGFKNVSLGNVIAAMPKQKITFVTKEDEHLIWTHHKDAFEVQVGLHELLGHGSGKLLMRNADGSFNFDKELKDMTTGKQVTSWYEPGETWGSKFGALASAYEECRAEAVGYFLCTYPDILKIFGYEGPLADTVKYVNWLSEMRAGLLGLEYYSPASKTWGQAHCFARYTLLRVCLDAGGGFLSLSEVKGDDGKPDLLLRLDPSKIDSVGKPAVGAFLRKLQAYKSTADFEGGSKMFHETGAVTEENMKWRDIVIARRQPRRLFLQANTVLGPDGGVTLKTYSESFEGIVESFVERYSAESIADLETVWRRDLHLFDL